MHNQYMTLYSKGDQTSNLGSVVKPTIQSSDQRQRLPNERSLHSALKLMKLKIMVLFSCRNEILFLSNSKEQNVL